MHVSDQNHHPSFCPSPSVVMVLTSLRTSLNTSMCNSNTPIGINIKHTTLYS